MITGLNSRFAPYGFEFSLISMDVVISAVDSDKRNPGFSQARIDSMRKGSYDALNIFTFSQLPEKTQGVCPSIAIQSIINSRSFFFCPCYSPCFVSDGNDMLMDVSSLG